MHVIPCSVKIVPVDDHNRQSTKIDNNYNYNIARISSTQINEFEVKMPSQITLLYMILTKMIGQNSEIATQTSQMVSQRYVALIILSTTVVSMFVKPVIDYSLTKNKINTKFGGTLSIILDVIMLVSWILMFVNVNCVLLDFKKKSFVLYWKLISVTMLMVAISYWRYSFGVESFDQSIFTFNESCFNSVVLALCFVMAIICFSLNQGWNVPRFVKLTAIMFIGVLFASYSLMHFLNDKDVKITFLQQTISIRSIIVSTAFDMMLWHVYLFYQTWKRPNVIQMVSKVEIRWVDDNNYMMMV